MTSITLTWPPVMPTVRRGDKGGDVKTLQALLVVRGFPPGRTLASLDGVFGPATERSLLAFQKQRGLPEQALTDGPTWQALLRA